MNLRFRLLLFAIILLLGITPAFASEAPPPETRQQVLQNFNQAYQEADYVQAIRWGLELEKLRPDDPLQQYNLACVYALVGNDQSAIAWLRKSVGNGFRRTPLLETDTDLTKLREHPQWSGILAASNNNNAAYIHSIRQAFSLAPPEIVLPPNHDSENAVPLIIALHGYGGRPEGYPMDWRPAAGKIGAILAAPRGLQRLDQAFFWGGVEETDAIVQLTIEYVKDLHLIDEDHIILTGFSQGGTMVRSLAVRHPEIFEGVIPMAGGYNSRIDAPPPKPGKAPRYFFMVGSQDKGKPQTRRAAEDFEAAGYTVDIRIYPGVGHTFPKFTDRELSKALQFIME